MWYYYCPYCGNRIDPQTWSIDVEKEIECDACHNFAKFKKFEHEYGWYANEAFKRYDDFSKSWRIMREEIEANPLFGTKERKPSPETQSTPKRDMLDVILKAKREQQAANSNLPKCPTCGSTNISKLSTINRAVHGAAFGLFSKTARSQWKCGNCGNMW